MCLTALFLGPQRQSCPRCFKSYKYKYHLNSHINYECGKEPRFQCFICFKKFHQKYNLNAHMKSHQVYSNFA